MRIIGNNISMIRGDTESITIELEKAGTVIPFDEGDKIYFTVKTNINTKDKVIQKIVTEFTEEGKAIIEISPEDTKDLNFCTYIYDIQLNKVNGDVKTIIPPKNFIIEGEVTYE